MQLLGMQGVKVSLAICSNGTNELDALPMMFTPAHVTSFALSFPLASADMDSHDPVTVMDPEFAYKILSDSLLQRRSLVMLLIKESVQLGPNLLSLYQITLERMRIMAALPLQCGRQLPQCITLRLKFEQWQQDHMEETQVLNILTMHLKPVHMMPHES
eukprot:3867059-Amphidinium_carterae.1